MKVYLDYSATTPLAPEVKQALHTFLEETFGNPSSPHRFGQRAKIVLEETRDLLAARLQCLPREIVFTSGGTESNNLALIGAATANRSQGNHLIISALEHASVLASARTLEKSGFDITWLESDSGGVIAAGAVEAQLRPSTILVSVMHVNNETGVINPVKEIAELCRDRGILYHIDAVQAFGKIPVSLADIPAALASLSAHKIYAPKGVGALFIRQGAAFDAILHGGPQEANRRPGTENMPGIAGFGAALHLPDNSIAEAERILGLQKYFEHRLMEWIPDCQIIGWNSPRSPYISNISFPGLSNESLLLNLDLAGIAASAGAACSSGSLRQAHVLKAMRLPDHVINGAVRFSFGRFTTMAEIDYTLSALKEIWQRLAGK
jgi:cysteine desulfurase